MKIHIKLLLSIGLTVTSGLICMTAFGLFYTSYFSPYKGTVTTKTEEIQRLNIIAVGDIMLSRNVARHAEKGGGPTWIWENIYPFLLESDFNFGNLESPTNGTSIYSYEKTMIFNGLPGLISTLGNMNFSVVNLANNHALDQGESGLITTQKMLESINIAHIGTGTTQEEAWTPKIIEKNDIKIAFIGASYASYNDDGTRKSPMIARMQDEIMLEKSIQDAKTKADIIIVSMHAGTEYSRNITELQENFSHRAIDAGADLVIGAHPHWTQRIESYKNAYILYSLGNFVFDQEFSPETKSGLAAQIFIEKKKAQQR